MDLKTIIDIALTAAIAAFACLTWRATHKYAYLTGLTLFTQAHKDVVGAVPGADRNAGLATMKMVREQFPDIYEKMKGHISEDSRRKIEGA